MRVTHWDNLKLGYSGTKQEMERLLEDAEKLTGKKFDISNFSDITEAIHAVQTEMGITGTTAKEASGTIQGSLGAVKSSWQNLLTGFADGNRDMGELMDNFVNSVGDAAKNIIPRVKQAVKSITQNLGDLAGKLVSGFFGEKTGAAVKKTVDVIMRAVERLLKILEGFGPIIEIAMNFISELVSNILPPLMSILETLMPIIEKIVGFVANVLTGAVKVLGGALKALEGILKPILDLLSPLFDLLGMIGEGLGAIGDGIGWLLAGCPKVAANFDEVMESASKLSTEIENTVSAWDNFIESQDNALQTSKNEIDQITALKQELDGLVDKNGKVKKGYEERAEYVANELSQITGQEIEIVDGQIKKYDELGKKIEETIQKKKIAALEEYYSDIMNEYSKNAGQVASDLRRVNGELETVKDTMANTSSNTDEYNQLVEQQNELEDKRIQLLGQERYWARAKTEQEQMYTAIAKKDFKTLDNLITNHTELVEVDGKKYYYTTQQKVLDKQWEVDTIKGELDRAIKNQDEAAIEEYGILLEQREKELQLVRDQYLEEGVITKEGFETILGDVGDSYIRMRMETEKGTKKTIDTMDNELSKGKGKASARGRDITGGFINSLSGGTDKARSATRSLWNAAVDGLSGGGLWEVAFAANNMVDTFISTIRSKRQQSYNAGWFVSKGATKGMMDAAQIKSPSRVTRWIGNMMTEGLRLGWADKSKKVIDTINKDMRFSGSMDFSSSISHNSIVGELLKYVKSIDKKSGKSGNVYFNGSRGDNIDDFSRVLSRQVIMARRV